MKKLIFVLSLFFTFMLPVMADELPEVTEHEKVTIYIFRGHGCSHCYDAIEYFNEIAPEHKDYFEVKTYEVWQNQSNNDLMNYIASSVNLDSTGVPFIVVGSSYAQAGFSEAIGEQLITVALDEYQNDSYVDVVNSVAKDFPDAKMTTLNEAALEEGIIKKPKSAKDVIIVTGVLVVMISGIAALVIFSRKK